MPMFSFDYFFFVGSIDDSNKHILCIFERERNDQSKRKRNEKEKGSRNEMGVLTANTRKTNNIYITKKNGPSTLFPALISRKSKSPNVARNRVYLIIFIDIQ